MQMSFLRPLAAACLAALLISGCSDDPASPGIQPEIVNTSDAFGYQVSAVTNYSGVQAYTWTNADPMANVNISTARAGGAGTLRVFDANGTEVFQRSLSDNGTYSTTSGQTGDWTIRVEYDKFSGNVNFRAERTTG
jgi:hypothetical protein